MSTDQEHADDPRVRDHAPLDHAAVARDAADRAHRRVRLAGDADHRLLEDAAARQRRLRHRPRNRPRVFVDADGGVARRELERLGSTDRQDDEAALRFQNARAQIER